jgi:hypothetical protein
VAPLDGGGDSLSVVYLWRHSFFAATYSAMGRQRISRFTVDKSRIPTAITRTAVRQQLLCKQATVGFDAGFWLRGCVKKLYVLVREDNICSSFNTTGGKKLY